MNERELREFERGQKSRQRLVGRVRSAVETARDKSAFWTDHPEVHNGWTLLVEHRGSFVWVNASLVDPAVKIIPFNGRAPLLDRFWAELDAAVTACSAESHLEVDRTEGKTTPVILNDGDGSVLSGWQWIVKVPGQ
jgi:hypothetical protein